SHITQTWKAPNRRTRPTSGIRLRSRSQSKSDNTKPPNSPNCKKYRMRKRLNHAEYACPPRTRTNATEKARSATMRMMKPTYKIDTYLPGAPGRICNDPSPLPTKRTLRTGNHPGPMEPLQDDV